MTTTPPHSTHLAEAVALHGPTDRRPVDCRSWEIGEAFLQGMLLEVSTGLKPGLVCPESNGAHDDMGLRTFMVGAATISPSLVLCAQSGREHTAALPLLLPELRRIGVQYESRLLRATHQVNTQRGILFAAGLLSGAAGFLSRTHSHIEPEALFDAVSAMSRGLVQRELAGANLRDKPNPTAGERLYLEYGATGIRGEVEQGFPSVRKAGLPALCLALKNGCSLEKAMLHSLVSLMELVEDTTILKRKGPDVLQSVQNDAARILHMGSVFTKKGFSEIKAVNKKYISKNISPGGSADLLSVSTGVYILENRIFPSLVI